MQSHRGRGRGMLVTCTTVLALVAVALGLLAAPLAAEAQQPRKIPRIGVLRSGSPPDRTVEAFRQGLHDLGYVEGQNIALEIRWAELKHARLPALAAELVGLKVDILAASGPPAIRAVKEATSTIPIVMMAMDDAVGHGFVASLARPGGNVTGLSFQTDELSGKWLQLLKEALPTATRLAVLWDATGTVNQLKTVERLGPSVGVQLHILEVRRPEDLEGAFEAAKKRGAQGLIILGAPFLTVQIPRLVELATKSRLPAVYYSRDFAHAGGLMAYGPSLPAMFRRAATYVDKILKGAKPADLPVEQPMRFELVINLKTAKALGLTLPQSILIRADQVIQ